MGGEESTGSLNNTVGTNNNTVGTNNNTVGTNNNTVGTMVVAERSQASMERTRRSAQGYGEQLSAGRPAFFSHLGALRVRWYTPPPPPGCEGMTPQIGAGSMAVVMSAVHNSFSRDAAIGRKLKEDVVQVQYRVAEGLESESALADASNAVVEVIVAMPRYGTGKIVQQWEISPRLAGAMPDQLATVLLPDVWALIVEVVNAFARVKKQLPGALDAYGQPQRLMGLAGGNIPRMRMIEGALSASHHLQFYFAARTGCYGLAAVSSVPSYVTGVNRLETSRAILASLYQAGLVSLIIAPAPRQAGTSSASESSPLLSPYAQAASVQASSSSPSPSTVTIAPHLLYANQGSRPDGPSKPPARASSSSCSCCWCCKICCSSSSPTDDTV